jgi:hypothetical protein
MKKAYHKIQILDYFQKEEMTINALEHTKPGPAPMGNATCPLLLFLGILLGSFLV